jgi:hypothetical protein
VTALTAPERAAGAATFFASGLERNASAIKLLRITDLSDKIQFRIIFEERFALCGQILMMGTR